MKSNIDSDRIKSIVYEAVEKALAECAAQHNLFREPYDGIDGKTHYPSEGWLKFADLQPEELKLTFLFKWNKQDDPQVPYEMHCAPIIKLSDK